VISLRPARGLAGAAAVVLVATAILARVVSPGLDIGGARTFAMADLPGILLWEDTKPSAWTLDNLVSNPHDVLEIPIRSMTHADTPLWEPDGYVGGRFTNFSGPDGVFMSWGTVFATDAQAATALRFYQQEMQSIEAWGLGAGARTDLGDDGWVYTGETTAFTSPPTGIDPIRAQIYLWRDGNLLLAVGGWFDFDPAEVLGAAEGMDRRAEAAATAR
jgi:hypothetical protein